jgi:hypothetical protein
MSRGSGGLGLELCVLTMESRDFSSLNGMISNRSSGLHTSFRTSFCNSSDDPEPMSFFDVVSSSASLNSSSSSSAFFQRLSPSVVSLASRLFSLSNSSIFKACFR